jgi:hypothetical protein
MKQIIRLTESDLHNIIRESVRRVLREQDEYTEADLETAKKKMKALKKKGGPEYLKAAQEWQKIKEKLGKVNVVNQPGADWSEKENEKRNIMSHEKFKHVDPRKRKDIDKDKKPKQSEITKGREQIAKDALKREKELRSIEQGAADTD